MAFPALFGDHIYHRGSAARRHASHRADNDLTLKEAALKLGFVSEEEFNRVVDPAKMVKPYVASAATSSAAS
jgi:fumarate hydratase class II